VETCRSTVKGTVATEILAAVYGVRFGNLKKLEFSKKLEKDAPSRFAGGVSQYMILCDLDYSANGVWIMLGLRAD
jgi:hypothetical protein